MHSITHGLNLSHCGLMALAVAGLTIASCSEGNDANDTQRNAAVANAAAPIAATDATERPARPVSADRPNGTETVGGDGSDIKLNPLLPTDIAALDGELGCSFTTTGAKAPILIAKGNVASSGAALGVVKVADSVERVATPGGFDAMLKGGSFTGAGKTIRIALTGASTGGGESPPMPATLTYDRADGAKRVFEGVWTCGP